MGHYNRRITRLAISMTMGLPSYWIFALIRNFPFSQITIYAFFNYGLTASVGFFLIFEAQQIKSNYLNKRLPWEKKALRRVSVELISSLIITAIVVTSCYAFLYLVIWEMPFFLPSVYLYLSLVYFISLCFVAFINAAPIMNGWKSSIIRAEQLEKETVEAKLQALRTQLSPHFFFNNLSILNGLVDKHPDVAKTFIARLSEVFRYILRHKNDEVVPLAEEVDFIRDYIFLIESRFEEKVLFEMDLGDMRNLWVPPVSLQQLLENAVKHNESSYKHPLRISISRRGDWLVVKNQIQPRKGHIESGGLGLETIQSRFESLTSRPPIIEKTDEYFQVSLPLLTIESVTNEANQ